MKSKNSVFILILVVLFGAVMPAARAVDEEAAETAETLAELAEPVDPVDPAAEDLLEPLDEELAYDAVAETAEVVPVEAVPAADVAQATDIAPAEEIAKIEEAKPVESAAPVEAAVTDGEKKESLLEKYPPQIKISQWGPEIRLNVVPDPLMGEENVTAVQSVKLETEKGEYLGLKTFQAEETTREAEFMINPEILKIETVKITVSSKSGDQWSHVQALKDEKGAGPEAGTPDVVAEQPVAAASEKSKKKGWWG